jgi:Fe-S cluster assembly iron-binding protein IscA
MITITELAANKVKEISKAEGLDGQGLRLRVIGSTTSTSKRSRRTWTSVSSRTASLFTSIR